MHALNIQDLVKVYKNGKKALNHISLTVDQGDFFALLGPNGAGKTTLIGIVTSLINKSNGSVSIFDQNIDQNFALAKSYIGVVPQEFNFNIFEKVEQILITQAGYYGIEPARAKKQAEYFLRKLELWEMRKNQVRMLSGGMKRRLMIARALIHNPKLLILDEPTAGVDVEIRRSMWTFLREINRSGTTIILTTHYLEEAESLCKKIAIINHGNIIENTSMSDLLYTLHLETFILYLDHPITTAPTIENYPCRLIDNKTLEVDIQKPFTLNQLFTQLSQQNIHVSSMKNKANRLEELFIKLTLDKKNEQSTT